MKFILIILNLVLILFLGNAIPAYSGEITDRFANYPLWNFPSNINQRSQDLFYPDWMVGRWKVTSILVDQLAPFSPDIVTPGFESNKRYLNQPIDFNVRFKPQSFPIPQLLSMDFLKVTSQPIVADREFNALNIAQAYLGKEGILGIKINPQNPNYQITFLPENNQLISRVTGRTQESPNADEFLTSEITQQIFQSNNQFYLNQVETTTDYHLQTADSIVAEQVTAIYLSPQDPNYFRTINHPVALYRYQLTLSRYK